MYYLAFLGTGQCDPNKTVIQIATGLALVTGWLILIATIRKINKSNITSTAKQVFAVLLIIIGLTVSALAIFGTWIGLMCSG